MPSLQSLLFRFYFGCAIVGVLDIVGFVALRVVAEISGVWDAEKWGDLFWGNLSVAGGALVLSVAFLWLMSWVGRQPGLAPAATEAGKDTSDTCTEG